MSLHSILIIDDVQRCVRCERSFSKHVWGDCPGVKQYEWHPWPVGLATKKQLAKKGLKVVGDPVGAIYYEKSADGDGWLRLWREADAQPKPEKTDKQKAALEKLKAANYRNTHCSRCDARIRRRQGGGLCDQCCALEWAADMLNKGFILFDCETTGLDYSSEIIQIGIVDQTGAVLLDSFIKPTKPIDENHTAFEINGISNAMVADAPTLPEIYPQLQALMEGKTIVAYNEQFDSEMLERNRKRHGLALIVATWDCAMLLYSMYAGEYSRKYRDYRWQSLDTACWDFEIQVVAPAHSGVGDCLRTLEVIKAMATRWNEREDESIQQLD